ESTQRPLRLLLAQRLRLRLAPRVGRLPVLLLRRPHRGRGYGLQDLESVAGHLHRFALPPAGALHGGDDCRRNPAHRQRQLRPLVQCLNHFLLLTSGNAPASPLSPRTPRATPSRPRPRLPRCVAAPASPIATSSKTPPPETRAALQTEADP